MLRANGDVSSMSRTFCLPMSCRRTRPPCRCRGGRPPGAAAPAACRPRWRCRCHPRRTAGRCCRSTRCVNVTSWRGRALSWSSVRLSGCLTSPATSRRQSAMSTVGWPKCLIVKNLSVGVIQESSSSQTSCWPMIACAGGGTLGRLVEPGHDLLALLQRQPPRPAARGAGTPAPPPWRHQPPSRHVVRSGVSPWNPSQSLLPGSESPHRGARGLCAQRRFLTCMAHSGSRLDIQDGAPTIPSIPSLLLPESWAILSPSSATARFREGPEVPGFVAMPANPVLGSEGQGRAGVQVGAQGLPRTEGIAISEQAAGTGSCPPPRSAASHRRGPGTSRCRTRCPDCPDPR